MNSALTISRLIFFGIMMISMFSIYITFSGFFLTTVKFPNTSNKNLLGTNDAWFQPKTKVVMLIVDALRFDYFHYNESIVGKEQYPYQNKFVKLHEIVKSNPENFVVIRTSSDAPTWTVQRVRCLVTGSIPPFIQIAQSLGASAAVEDSILSRLSQANKKSYAVGDPLWAEIFPKFLIDKYKSQSFDLKDMSSDQAVADVILSVVKENDFDLLIGHRLGVDHIGHSYHNSLDSRIGEQLALNDELAANIINSMDNNTVLFILGDHGMRSDGGHGGSEADEVSTVVAAYYKSGFQKYKLSGLDEVMMSIDARSTPMTQVDITPTLAMLLGVPVPFSNLGQVINDVYPNIKDSKPSSDSGPNKDGVRSDLDVNFVSQMLQDNYLNALQIYTFLATFQHETGIFADSQFKPAYNQFKEIQDRYQKLNSSDKQTAEFKTQAISLVLKMQSFSEKTYQLVRGTSSYDTTLIGIGISLMSLVLIMYILLIQYIHISQKDEELFPSLRTWTPEKAIIKIKANKLLYFTVFCLVLLGIIFGSSIIYLISIFILLSTIRAVYHFSMIVLRSPKETSSSNNSEVKDIDSASSHKPLDLESRDSPTRPEEIKKETDVLLKAKEEDLLHSSRSIFFIELPSHTIVTVLAIATTIVVANIPATVGVLENANKTYIRPNTPLLIAIALMYTTYTYPAKRLYQAIAMVMIVGLYFILQIIDPKTSWIFVQTQFALVMFGHYMWTRVRSLSQRSVNTIPIKWIHFANFVMLWIYYTPLNRDSIWVTIIIPRTIFVLLLSSCIAGYILAPSVFWRNLQFCLVQFLFLLQGPEQVLSFVTLLTVLRLTNYAFGILSFESFVYPVIVAIESYIWLYLLDHTDRTIGKINFAQAFVGLEGFNVYISGPMVLINTFTSFVLSLIFIVDYTQSSQRIWTRGEEFKDHKVSRNLEEDVCLSRLAISSGLQYHLSLLKIRNNVSFILFFGMIYMTAVLRCFFDRDNFINLTEENERYMLDATIYTLLMFGVTPMMF